MFYWLFKEQENHADGIYWGIITYLHEYVTVGRNVSDDIGDKVFKVDILSDSTVQALENGLLRF